MPTVVRPSGLTISLPEGYSLAGSPASTTSRRRKTPLPGGPVPMRPAENSLAISALLEAMAAQEMTLVDRVVLQPPPSATPRARKPSITARVDFDLAVAQHEDAVLLLEQDGMLSWTLPSEAQTEAAARGPMRAAPVRTLRFHLEVGGRPRTPSKNSQSAKGAARAPKRVRNTRVTGADGSSVLRVIPKSRWLTHLIWDEVKVHVFKFAARLVVTGAIQYLERNVRKGLVQITGTDPARWSLADLPRLGATFRNRQARILLFLHGTFSSTAGSFGGLCVTPWGRQWLETAQSNYDLVLGYDHPTLSEDPLTNATHLHLQLQQLCPAHPPAVDVVAFSRGGLVFRSLVEQLLPITPYQPKIQRAIFVACPNSGTELARPSNWHQFVDLYTNLIAAGCHVMALFPQAAAAALVLREAVQSVGALVKCLATQSVSDQTAPGLAAMIPDGPFITRLNEPQPDQPAPGATQYFGISAEFQARLTEGLPKELPKKLLLALADGVVDRVMGESNDLVVNQSSVTAFDPGPASWMTDCYDFGKTPNVYHTVYFLRPEVVNALARWLQLVKTEQRKGRRPRPQTGQKHAGYPSGPQPRFARVPRKLAQGRRGPPIHQKLAHFPPRRDPLCERVSQKSTLSPSPRPPSRLVPALVDTDILFLPKGTRHKEAVRMVKELSPSYAILEREHKGKTLHYALAAEEILRIEKTGRVTPLHEALLLRESGASLVTSVATVSRPPVKRAVVFDRGSPIGVVAGSKEAFPSFETLLIAAKASENPKNTTHQVLKRRTMPTFAAEVKAKPAPNPKSVDCRFRASMPCQVQVGKVASIEVVVSRNQLKPVPGRAGGVAGGKASPQRPLTIQVVPKAEFETVGEDRVEIPVPETSGDAVLLFDVRATHVGPGEVCVIARQGPVAIATILLSPAIVAADPVVVRSPQRAGPALNLSDQQQVTKPGRVPFCGLLLNRRVQVEKQAQPAPSKSFEHCLWIMERKNGNELRYHFQFFSPLASQLTEYQSDPMLTSASDYVAGVYEEIEKRWVSSQADAAVFESELRSSGANLFEELFPEKLRQLLWDNYKDLDGLVVVSSEPHIPWEIVHLKQPGKPLGEQPMFLGQLGLVRWLLEADLPPHRLRIRQQRARTVVPNYPPEDLRLEGAREEEAFLARLLKARSVDPQPGPVQALLQGPGGFDLLHFAGHAEAEGKRVADGELLLEGRVEGGKYVPSRISAKVVRNFSQLRAEDGTRPIVVLNACQSGRAGNKLTGFGGFAHSFLHTGAGVFIGTLWQVTDGLARTFIEEFYNQLLAKKKVSHAVKLARKKAREAGDPTWLAYTVYAHPSAKLMGEEKA